MAKTRKRDNSTAFSGSNLHVAAQNGDGTEVLSLLNSGYFINEADDEGNTPLMIAIKADSKGAAAVLVAKGADITIRNKRGESAYTLARGMLEKNNENLKETCERIVKWMRAKENLISRDCSQFKATITRFVAGKSQVREVEWDHIAALFPHRKAELMSSLRQLGTPRAVVLMDDLNLFDPFKPSTPVVETAKFFAPLPVKRDENGLVKVAGKGFGKK